jgi:hypothetical protein
MIIAINQPIPAANIAPTAVKKGLIITLRIQLVEMVNNLSISELMRGDNRS